MTRKQAPISTNYVVPMKWTIGAIASLIILSGSSVAFFVSQKNTLETQVKEAQRISAENNAILKQMQQDMRVQLKDIEQRQQLFDIRLTAIEITVGLAKK